MVPIVNGLETQFGDAMKFQVLEHYTDESQALIAKHELNIHGMVITDAEGKLLWKESGHNQTEAGVTKAIQQVLGR